MDWNGSMSLRTFVSRPLDDQSSSPLLYNIYNLDQLPVLEMKKPLMVEDQAQQVLGGGNGIMDQKKKRLSNEQLDSLERSFQEEIKLDPDRKMKLSQELGLQPKQIAVWFQNRRARWKNKHLEHLYDSLKQEFDTISREKHMLQQEVEKLRRMLREQVGKNQVSTTQTDISGEETVESTSMIKSSDNYIYNVEDFNQISAVTSFWSAAQPQIPSYPLD